MTFEEARRHNAYEIDPEIPDGRRLHQWLSDFNVKSIDDFLKTGVIPQELERTSYEVAKYGPPCVPISIPSAR